jgi:hypothetical protein
LLEVCDSLNIEIICKNKNESITDWPNFASAIDKLLRTCSFTHFIELENNGILKNIKIKNIL